VMAEALDVNPLLCPDSLFRIFDLPFPIPCLSNSTAF